MITLNLNTFYRNSLFLLACMIWCGLSISSCSSPEDEDPDVTADEQLYINEIFATGDDWIELYNASNDTKDISGYKIYDDVANKYTLPNSTTIPAKGFL